MYVLVHVATDYVNGHSSSTSDVGHSGLRHGFAPVLLGACTLALFWLILYWMYRNRVFVRFNLSRGASPLGTPLHALSHAASWFDYAHHALSTVEGRRRAPIAWLARRARSHLGMSVGSI